MTIKILAILPNPYGWKNLGGVAGGHVRMIEVFKRWHNRGVHIESLESTPSQSLIFNANYVVHEIKLPLMGYKSFLTDIVNWLLWNFRALALLIKLKLSKRSFDVIFSGASLSDISANFPGRVAHKIFCVPVVAVAQSTSDYACSLTDIYKNWRVHGLSRINSFLMAAGNFIASTFARDMSAFICVSRVVAHNLVNGGLPQNRIYVTGNAADTGGVGLSNSYKKHYDAVFMSRLEREKGIIDLIEIWKLVIRKKRNASLLIIGSGSCLEEARGIVKASNMEHLVKFAGFIAGNQKYEYLARSRVFVFPIKEKELSWGLVVSEALACGLPVLCYDHPVLKDIFGDCASVIFSSLGDIKVMAENLLNLLNNKDRLQEYSKLSKAYAKQRDWDTIADLELGIVKRVIDSHTRLSRQSSSTP